MPSPSSTASPPASPGVTVTLNSGAGTATVIQEPTPDRYRAHGGTNNADRFTGDVNANHCTATPAMTSPGWRRRRQRHGRSATAATRLLRAGERRRRQRNQLPASGTDTIYSYLLDYSLVDTDGAGANGGNVENGRIMSAGAANLTGNGLNNVLYAGTGNAGIIDGRAGVVPSPPLRRRHRRHRRRHRHPEQRCRHAGLQGTDYLTGIERLFGSSNADRFTGDGNANILCSCTGNDILDGGAGGDVMAGSDGERLLLRPAGQRHRRRDQRRRQRLVPSIASPANYSLGIPASWGPTAAMSKTPAS
ncbi:MAG: hypothetical protein U1E96_10610 [Azonexus sp.]